MSVFISVGHIVGAIIVLTVSAAGIMMLARWDMERNHKTALQEASLVLGIPLDDLDNAEHYERIVQFAAERFSSELFRNRLSDLCGGIQTGWGWLSNLLQAGVLLGVIWYTVADDRSNSVYAWWIVGISLVFWIASVIFGYACKLLTGRFPGQAKQARKLLADVAEKGPLSEHLRAPTFGHQRGHAGPAVAALGADPTSPLSP